MESNKIKLTYLGNDVDIIQYISESNNQFNTRLEYIKKLENKKVDWKEAVRLSKIWYCIKYKSCRYSPEVYNKVISYDK
jgi:hypothetical protein